MERLRVLVTRHVYPEAVALLRDHTDVAYHDSRDGLLPDELRRAVADRHAVVAQLTDGIDAALLDAAPDLRIVANVAVGYDNIDVAAARARGVLVCNTPGVLTETTADLAFALILATARRLGEAERFLRAGRWQQWAIDLLAGTDVHGRTLGLIGMGRIAQAVARRAAGFGMRVLYHSRSRLAADLEQALRAEAVPLDALLGAADFVSVHLPLSDATRGFLGARELAAMREGAFLINTARGPVVDQEALIDALRSGHLGGAGLDVYDREPDLDPRLLDLPGTVLLPHVGSATAATRRRMCEMAAQAVVDFAQGRAPRHVVP